MKQANWVIGDLVTVDDERLTDMHGKDFPVVALPTSEITVIDASSVNEISAYYVYNYKLKLKETATMTNNTTAVATVNNEEEPKVWAVEVQFPYNYAQDIRKQDRKTYEYLAFGLFDELAEATHVVVCKEQYTSIDGLLEADDLSVARVLNVKPVSQLRYSGTAKYIVDIVDATAFVERNMKAVRTEQLRKDIKARLEKIREISVLERMVEETNDEVAKELLKELKGLS